MVGKRRYVHIKYIVPLERLFHGVGLCRRLVIRSTHVFRTFFWGRASHRTPPHLLRCRHSRLLLLPAAGRRGALLVPSPPLPDALAFLILILVVYGVSTVLLGEKEKRRSIHDIGGAYLR